MTKKNISIHDPSLLAFSKLRQNSGSDEKIFIADGEKTVVRLLQSGLKMRKILCLEKYFIRYRDFMRERGIEDENIFVAEKSELEKITGFSIHQGLMALAERPNYIREDDLKFPLVVLNGIKSAENMGAIARSCLALGFRNLLFDQESCAPYNRRSVRVSMAAVFSMSFAKTMDLTQSLENFRLRGARIISSTAKTGKGKNMPNKVRSVYDFSFPEKFVLVVGSEGDGIDKNILAQSDVIITIPMQEPMESLNAAAALTALLLKANSDRKNNSTNL